MMSGGVEFVTDSANAAIHHVRWRNDVRAGDRVGDGRTGEQLDGGIVDDRLSIDNAAVTVRSVLTQTDVGDDQDVAGLLLDGPHCGLNRSVVVPGS